MTKQTPKYIVKFTRFEDGKPEYLTSDHSTIEYLKGTDRPDDFSINRFMNNGKEYTKQEATDWVEYINSLDPKQEYGFAKMYTKMQDEGELGAFTKPTTESAEELSLALGTMYNYGEAIRINLETYVKCNGEGSGYGLADFKQITQDVNDKKYSRVEEIKNYIGAMAEQYDKFMVAFKQYETEQDILAGDGESN